MVGCNCCSNNVRELVFWLCDDDRDIIDHSPPDNKSSLFIYLTVLQPEIHILTRDNVPQQYDKLSLLCDVT